jgi:hypothetical protein
MDEDDGKSEVSQPSDLTSLRRILEGTEKRVPDCSRHVGDHAAAGCFLYVPRIRY